MENFVDEYYAELARLMAAVAVSGPGFKKPGFSAGVEAAADLIEKQAARGRNLMFIGNGASAAISSHQAADYAKNGGMRAMAFNDPALLTCVSNDISYERVFEVPLRIFAGKGDVLVAICSSGRSSNVLRAVKAAREKGCHIVTLSGFSAANPLRRLGDINFHVPSSFYGHVEIMHHSICHCVLELILERSGKRK